MKSLRHYHMADEDGGYTHASQVWGPENREAFQYPAQRHADPRFLPLPHLPSTYSVLAQIGALHCPYSSARPGVSYPRRSSERAERTSVGRSLVIASHSIDASDEEEGGRGKGGSDSRGKRHSHVKRARECTDTRA